MSPACGWTAGYPPRHAGPVSYELWLPNAREWVPTCAYHARIFEALLRADQLEPGQILRTRQEPETVGVYA